MPAFYADATKQNTCKSLIMGVKLHAVIVKKTITSSKPYGLSAVSPSFITSQIDVRKKMN